MALIERDGFLALLQQQYDAVASGEGHCVLVTGEAGIGKTTLVKTFCKQKADECHIYQGACDGLFTPRPLAPLFDILWQVNKERWPSTPAPEDRSALFADLFQELSGKKGKLLIVFEDIHWADEGTLDFIRFFVRRIYQLPCLFILTYRDDEVFARHPLRNVLGQLPPDSFSRLAVTPLSKEAVVELATQKGYSGEEVYSIAGGNPFYVTEILASYSPGVPDNIKDAILSVYEQQEEGTKNAWQILSVIPEGLEIDRFSKLKTSWDEAMNHCFTMSVLVVQQNKVVFKHELYRRTIEESLTPFKRIELNKLMLDLFAGSFEQQGEIERLLHYAKNANEKELVVKYAPLAARKAAATGAHTEAARLLRTAIEYAEETDRTALPGLQEAYAYECYLVSDIKEAIAYTEKVLAAAKERSDIEKTGDSLRFLSRLWWFHGNRKQAETFATAAIEALKNEPASAVKAMALSNMSQLKMLSAEPQACIDWGQQAFEMAKGSGNKEIMSHALNNTGSVKMVYVHTGEEGRAEVEQSLDIALQNGYQEHAARAYTNLATGSVKIKDYVFAGTTLDNGIAYCDEKDLNSWRTYMLSWKARLYLETCRWQEAYDIATDLLKNEALSAIIRVTALVVTAKILMRRGEKNAPDLLQQATTMAFDSMESQRVIPVMTALLEYEWLTGNRMIEKEAVEQSIALVQQTGIDAEKDEFAFWMQQAGREYTPCKPMGEAYNNRTAADTIKAAAYWEQKNCLYEQALLLFTAGEEEKKNALSIMQQLGAEAVQEKMKQEMRNLGIKNIPRGIRQSTRANIALLTGREMDVLQLLKQDLQNKEIAAQLYISAKTVDHHISSILFKLEAGSRGKAVAEAIRIGILK